jgi:predicted PurR-regulated permease PerM
VIGILSGLASFIPYFGFITGITVASITALVQTGSAFPLVWVLLIYGIGQALESMVLTPNLIGGRIGLGPVATIFALLTGGELFGFVGILVALPVAAVIAVLLRHTRNFWLRSSLYRGLPPPVP